MTAEFDRIPKRGGVMLAVLALATIGDIYWIVMAIRNLAQVGRYAGPGFVDVASLIAAILSLLALIVLWCGLFTLQPNEGAVLLLFGNYKGTAKRAGLSYANPFYTTKKVSLRARNFNTEKLKVNDQRGNPIEIAAVIVWRVHDTARALFDVDDYTHYVAIQSESAIRHLASLYPYDHAEDHGVSLRGSMDEVARALQGELQERLSKAGCVVEEARLSHLAYAPEIAGAMLRRQQAEAIVAARSRIVEGAVGMVHMALDHLQRDAIVELDAERKAAMVSNLLVVLCGEQAASPVINAGTLHTETRGGGEMVDKKPVLLRIPPDLYDALARWARDELRSVNAQIEFVLRDATRKREGRKPRDAAGDGAAASPSDDRNAML